jgi:hypothetical protein
MRKYLSVFNVQTLIVLSVSLISSAICLYFQLSIFLDFLIIGIMIVFPLTFSLTAAFRRRERALQYLSLFKGSLQSVYYAFQNAKLELQKKNEFKNVANNISEKLIQYLLTGTDASAAEEASHAIFNFIKINEEIFKRTFSLKIFLFIFRLNESIEFLLATKRHHTPWGVRALVLFSIYSFIIFYPASLLNDVGFAVPFWYVFLMTAFKGILLISLYNVQSLLEDPFNQKGPDGIRLNDFRFSPVTTSTEESVPIIKQVDQNSFRI